MAAFQVRGVTFETVRARTLHELAGKLNELAESRRTVGANQKTISTYYDLEIVHISTETQESNGDYERRLTEPMWFEALIVVGYVSSPQQS